jgi:hypothetical protein
MQSLPPRKLRMAASLSALASGALVAALGAFLILPASAAAAVAAPVIRYISPNDGDAEDPFSDTAITYTATFQIQGTADPNVTVALRTSAVDVGTTQADASGFWQIPYTGSLDAVGAYKFVAKARNAEGVMSADSNEYTVWYSRVVVSGTLTRATVGEPVNFHQPSEVVSGWGFSLSQLAVTGLPPGLQYVDGYIRGTPTAAGLYRVTVSAGGMGGVDKKTFTCVVAPPSSAPPPPTSWQSADIGQVGIPGATSTWENTIKVTASGSDIWDTADAFRFVYRRRSGNCLVEAQVWGLSNTDAWAKAGVMIRESTAANARNVLVLMNPSNVLSVQQRATTGGITTSPGKWWLSPQTWVRLVRTGDTFAAYSSPDGKTWTLRTTVTVAMPADVLVGFAVTSHNNAVTTSGIFLDPFVN